MRQLSLLNCHWVYELSEFLPAATNFGQGNIFTSVCQEFCSQGGGVCLSACWDTPPRTRHTPPGADPPDQARPPADTPLPPKHTAAYAQRAAGTHPTGMHSCSNLRTLENLMFQILRPDQNPIMSIGWGWLYPLCLILLQFLIRFCRKLQSSDSTWAD